ncbi:MAG TPA: RDD family protein [Streptosporangiaceae bacterium]|nr:RDD family protein [Streptosporangiaceae bacterium]
MTQQNETEHETAGPARPATASSPAPLASPPPPPAPSPAQAAQPAQPGPTPVFPSPYLDGEAMPQAYLAPPQPGQPRYGSAPAQSGRPFGGGPPQYGQPGSARPAGGRAAAARRDPALASPWYRLVASTLDWIIIIVVSVIAFWSPLSRIGRELQAIATRYPDLTSPAAQAALNSVSRDPANQRALVYWFLSMFGIALVYYWVQQAAWGATIGKRALGVRVVRAADRSRIGIRQAGIRTVAFLAGPAILMLLVSPINYLGAALWAADAGLPLLDPQAQALHDKLAGTVVVRQRWLDERSAGAQSW